MLEAERMAKLVQHRDVEIITEIGAAVIGVNPDIAVGAVRLVQCRQEA
jgi:hypothetical protein